MVHVVSVTRGGVTYQVVNGKEVAPSSSSSSSSSSSTTQKQLTATQTQKVAASPSSSSQSSAPAMTVNTQLISDVQNVNRQRGAELFVINNEGKIGVNQNLTGTSREEATKLGERYGFLGKSVVSFKGGSTSSSSSSDSGSSTSKAFTDEHGNVYMDIEDVIAKDSEGNPMKTSTKNFSPTGDYYVTPEAHSIITQVQANSPSGPMTYYWPNTKQQEKPSEQTGNQVFESYVSRTREEYKQQVNTAIGTVTGVFGLKIDDVPYVSDFLAEGSTQLKVGMEQIQASGVIERPIGITVFETYTSVASGGASYKAYGRRYAPEEVLGTGKSNAELAFEGISRVVGAGVGGFTTGMGIGTITTGGLAIVGGATGVLTPAYVQAGTNVAINVAKLGAATTAFDTGLNVGGAALGGKDVGKAFSESLSPERIARNTIIGAGVGAATVEIAPEILTSGVGFKTGQAAIGAFAGGVAGTTYALAEHKAEQSIQYGLTGATIGGAIGFTGAALEEKGIKPTLGIVEQRRVDTKTGVATDEFRGGKVGIEYVNPKTGEPSFWGVAVTKEGGYIGTGAKIQQYGHFSTNTAAKNEVLIPKGIFELMSYGSSEYQAAFKNYAIEYYNVGEVNQGVVKEQIENVAGSDAKGFITATRESGGVFGGSTVERGIGNKITLNPRFAAGSSKDVDVAFYSVEDFETFRGMMPGGSTLKAGEVGIKGVESLYTQKHTGTLPSGGEVDISIMTPSLGYPKAPTPMSQFAGIFTFQKGSEFTTYSTQQQLGTKFMTVGYGSKGEVRPIEPTKTKYLYDIASMNSKSTQETQGRYDVMSVNLAVNTPKGGATSISIMTGQSFSSAPSKTSQTSPKSNSISAITNSLATGVSSRSILSLGDSSPSTLSHSLPSSSSKPSRSSSSSSLSDSSSSSSSSSSDDSSQDSSSSDSRSSSSYSISILSSSSFSSTSIISNVPPFLPGGGLLGGGAGGGLGIKGINKPSKKLRTLADILKFKSKKR